MSLTLILALVTLSFGVAIGEPTCQSGCECTEDNISCTDTNISLTQDSIPNPATIKNATFQRCNITIIAPNSFSLVTRISSVLILNSIVGTVQGNAFYGMTGVDPEFRQAGEYINGTGILFSNATITTLAKDAFKGLKKIQYVVIREVILEGIETGAFAYSEIDNIVIQNSTVESIASRAFDVGLTKTKGIYITSSGFSVNPGIPAYAFAGIKDGDLYFHSVKLGTIHANAFASESVNLTIISCTLANISTDAFDGARNVRSLILNKMVMEEIETGIFGDMTGRHKVTFSEMTVKRIQGRAFEGLRNFERFIFTKNRVECADPQAFWGIECLVTNTENQYTGDDCSTSAGAILKVFFLQILLATGLGFLLKTPV